MRRVVVTGLGAVTPLGVGVRRSWTRLINGHIGVVSLSERGPQFDSLPSRVAGLVPRGSREQGGWDPKDWLEPGDERRMALFTQYAVAAAEEALQDSGCLPCSDEDREAMGVCLGSGIGAFEDVYDTSVTYSNSGYKKVSPLFVPRLLINLAAGHISMRHALHGPNLAPTTACTTGAHAIGDAYRLIAHPSPTAPSLMLAGASESTIHPLAVAGFARARSLCVDANDAPAGASRPFDRSRAGFVMGEGAGVVVLEERGRALARGARVYAEIRGYGCSADAWHMTAPRADGFGAALAMKRALSEAGVAPGDVDYVNAHATSTVLGDAAENRAVMDVLLGRAGAVGEGKQRPEEISVSSSKGAMGHLLGAAGAVEAIFTVLAVHEGVLPPTVNLREPGDPPGSKDESEMQSAEDGKEAWSANYIPNVAQERGQVRAALTNSFGFGGTNASLCFVRPDRN